MNSLFAAIKNIKISLPKRKNIRSGGPHPPIKAFRDRKESVPFRVLKRGSLTVEAAMALPLFFMITICIMSMMGVYSSVVKDMIGLRNETESAAMLAGASDSSSWVELGEISEFRPFYLPSSLSAIHTSVIGRARCWTGRDDASAQAGAQADASAYVYVTEYGSVYHTDPSCTHISLSISSASMSAVGSMTNEYGAHYHACDKCVGTGSANSVVYITEEGDCYHNSLECSGLKRTVRLVPADEAAGLPICSRCAAAA